MTTIACDGKSMAGDGLITTGDVISDTRFAKVRRLSDGRIVGMAGNAYNWDVYWTWLDNGTEGEPPKVHETFGCLVMRPDGSLWSYDELGRCFPENAPCALGSGGSFALMAMDCGKSAEEAVAMACGRDTCSGGEITCLRLEPALRAVE